MRRYVKKILCNFVINKRVRIFTDNLKNSVLKEHYDTYL